MSNKYCELLLHEIAFYKNSLRPCCSFSIEGDVTPFVNNYNGEIAGLKDYLKKRETFINIFKSGNKPFCYNGCTIYTDSKESDTSVKFNNIIISNRTKCSCNCIYCEHAAFGQNPEYKAELNSKLPYDIKPALSFLMQHNYIEKNCRFLICGGECSEYPEEELDWLVYFTLMNEGQLLFLSSGINYSESIEKALKISKAILKISVDSGTEYTYEQIKRIKAYDTVWNNIKKYIQYSAESDQGHVELKYIILPGINDNLKEISAFIHKCHEVNCKEIVIDIEHQYLKQNKDKIKDNANIKNLLNKFFEIASQGQNPIHVSFEGVEEPFLWSLVDKQYNYK